MKKTLSVLLAAVLLAGCTTASSSAASSSAASVEEETEAVFSTSAYQDQIDAYVNAVDMDYAYNLAYTLSTDTSMHENALGFRNSGSDAEHKAAEFIAEEMKSIGLTDVEMVPVTVDKWQFNGASLTLEGSEIALEPVSYMVNGTDEDGITAEIVDVGTGFAADYEGLDVEGKIVLVGVDQWNESWIDGYIYEAEEHGAAAIVSYDLDGYGRASSDDHQIQDICCEDVMPTVIITRNEYDELKAEIDAGHTLCTLTVDSVMEENSGTSYNVIGYIKGKSSDQQIIFSGHYDMYFTGFQDDCSAIATAMAMAKGMIDSGYVPENDIVVVAHGAEEWGATGTEFDWTRGAWEMIHTAHPEWAEKTLAMFNFELSAFDDGGDQFAVSCVPEYSTLVCNLIDAGALDNAVSEYSEGIMYGTYDTTTMEDGVSYRDMGVPYFINVTDTCAGNRSEDEYGWTQLNYHTESDNASTYSEKVMRANISVFGSIAIAVDQSPATMLDLRCGANELTWLDEDYAAEAGVDTEEYRDALTALYDYADEIYAEGAEINERYFAASDEEKEAVREEAEEYNKKVHEIFKTYQDEFVGIEFSSDIVTKHMGYEDNLVVLDDTIACLEEGDVEGALGNAWMINAVTEYNYYLFSYDAVQKIEYHVDADEDDYKWWGENKGYVLAHTGEATMSLLAKSEEENPDVSEELAVYKAEREAQLALYKETVEAEIEAMKALVK